MTDTGSILNNLLLNQGLVHEISLLVHPFIVGPGNYNLFSNMNKKISLEFLSSKVFENKYIWMRYKVIR